MLNVYPFNKGMEISEIVIFMNEHQNYWFVT